MTHQPNPGRVQILLQRTDEEVFEPDSIADDPLVRFVAYDRHHRIFGWVRLGADRLTDLLNACSEIVLDGVEIEGLADGRTRSAHEIVVRRDDLIAVHASGPRGDLGRRHRTRTWPVALQAGSYLVGGHVHVAPGREPLADIRDRPPMIPLTDAWIEYWVGETRTKHSAGTIIVNRLQADWIRVVTDEDLVEGTLRPVTVPQAATA
jgi:hypothetical protein